MFALSAEAAFFRAALPRGARVAAPCPAWQHPHPGGRVLVVLSGMGPAAAGRALGWLFGGGSPHRPSLVVSAGFCGGLDAGLAVGALVAPAEVVDLEGGAWRTAGVVGGGRLVSVPAPVLTPQAKAELRQRTGAAAVDMESATVGRLCATAGVAFACLRAVSDDHRTALSADLGAALHGERVSVPRLLAAVARRPALVRELARLAGHSRTAGRALSAGLLGVLGGA